MLLFARSSVKDDPGRIGVTMRRAVVSVLHASHDPRDTRRKHVTPGRSLAFGRSATADDPVLTLRTRSTSHIVLRSPPKRLEIVVVQLHFDSGS
jgi:hypothetical protein